MATVPLDLEIPSESAEERATYLDRFRSLRESPELLRSYLDLLKEVWAPVDDMWQQALPVIDEAGRHVVAQYERGRSLEVLIPTGCDILRDRMPGILSGVESGQRALLFVPCLFFGSSMYLEFPGLVVIGTGVGQGDVEARARTESVARRLKAVADPTRLALLHSLATAPSTVGELAVLFRLAQPTVSMHVKVLRQNGLVRSERRAGRLRLSADAAAVEALLGELRRAVLQDEGASTTGKRPDAGHRRREHALRRARHGIVGEPRQQLLQEDPALQAGEARPQAHVLSESERQMHRVGRSPHVEARRIVPEDPLVTVRPTRTACTGSRPRRSACRPPRCPRWPCGRRRARA